MQSASRLSRLLPLAVFLTLAACDGDGGTRPDRPPPALWNEVTPSDLVGQSVVLSLASRAGRTIGLVARPNGNEVIQLSDDVWTATDLGFGSTVRVRDLALDSMGRAVLVGGDMTGGLRVWAERPDWTQLPLNSGGLLMSVTVDAADVFSATGFGSSAAPIASGTAEGDWTLGTIPTPGDPQEKGIVAITSDPSGLYACGWDDGSDGSPEQPYRLVLHDDGTGWKLLSPPDCDCMNREFTAIEADGQGHVFVGGAILDFSMNAPDWSVAFLLRYDHLTQTWTEVDLPDPGALDRVNRILVTSEQDVLLGCGQDDNGSIVRLPAGGEPAIEWSHDETAVAALVETGDGTLFAGGAHVQGSTIRAALWKRKL